MREAAAKYFPLVVPTSNLPRPLAALRSLLPPSTVLCKTHRKTESTMSTAAEPRSQEDIVRRYQTMTAECDKLVEKITELEFDRNEHSLVEETLQPLDAGRKAYRLVGGVLVERTVGEVLPSVKTNKENVSVDSRVG